MVDQVIKENYKALDLLIKGISGQYGRCKADRDDLYQIGWVVAIECAKKYDHRKNNNFIGYCAGAIKLQVQKAYYDIPVEQSISGFVLRDSSDGDVRAEVLSAIESMEDLKRDLIYSLYYHDINIRTWAQKNKMRVKEALDLLASTHKELKVKLDEIIW